MRPFDLARHDHAPLRTAARADIVTAAHLWGAITGTAEPPPDTFAEAVAATAPEEHAALLASHETAAAAAFSYLWGAPRWGETAFARRQDARAAWETFSAHAAGIASLVEGFGWDQSLAWSEARDVNPRQDDGMIARVAALAGRMFVALRGAASRKIAGVPGEVFSVELGGAVERLLPDEYGALMDPILEGPALYRVATRRASQYAVRGDQRRSKGPLVLALDESGSMHGARNEWSKAAAIAVARVAAAERRRVAVVHYSTSVEAVDLAPASPASVLAMVRHFMSGGTDIALALGRSLDEVARLAAKGDKGADVILVTDGIDPDRAGQQAALTRARAAGVRLWTVAIECEIPAGEPLRDGAVSYTELGRTSLTDAASVVSLAAAA